jgi:hypothetical protein
MKPPLTAAEIPFGGTDHDPPTETAPPVSLADALGAVRAFIHRYVRLTDEQTTLVAVWAAMTHALEAFDYVAYLHITSPLPECGKSRLLEVLESLVTKPWMTGRVTAAVLMRRVDHEHPTLLLDESDAAFSGDEQYAEALRGLLNAGFHREGKASCCVGQGANLTYKDFSVFGPKAIAGIGRLPSTIESRSIPVVMKRRTRGEAIEKFRRRDVWTMAGVMRDHLAAAVVDHLDALRASRPTMPDGLSDRCEDVLEPLCAIAALAGGDWPKAVSDAAVALMGVSARASREADQTLGLELLADIQQIVTARGQPAAIATKVLLEELAALEDRPWKTFGKTEKGLTGHKLARMLKPFEIVPAGTIQIEGKPDRGYRCAGFEEAFARYLGSEALERNHTNESGPEPAKSKALGDTPLTLSKTAKTPDKHCGSNAPTLSTPDHEENTPPDPPSGPGRLPRATNKTGAAPLPANRERDAAWERSGRLFDAGWQSNG